MRAFLSVMGVLALMGLAAWAYGENYATRAAAAERARIQREIGALAHERQMLEGEFAYLARPDRLRALADLNFSELRLVPMTPDDFGRMQEVPYPDAPEADAPGGEAEGGATVALVSGREVFP